MAMKLKMPSTLHKYNFDKLYNYVVCFSNRTSGWRRDVNRILQEFLSEKNQMTPEWFKNQVLDGMQYPIPNSPF